MGVQIPPGVLFLCRLRLTQANPPRHNRPARIAPFPPAGADTEVEPQAAIAPSPAQEAVAESEPEPAPPGETLLKQGDYAGAVKYFSRVIAAKPDFRSYFDRATAYRELGQMEKAVSDYSEAIRLKPESPVAYHDRALCELRLGLEQRAADDYDQALKIDPARPRLQHERVHD